jgi:transposase-like protein
MSELAYDIEQLYIEGHSPKMIAAILECPVEIVYGWITDVGCEAEEFDPHNTVNS